MLAHDTSKTCTPDDSSDPTDDNSASTLRQLRTQTMARWQMDTGYLTNSSFTFEHLRLPRELDVRASFAPPTYKVLSQANLKEDIILLAEFSEIEGPMPLLTIPPQTSVHLDLNDFVVKVMSTDYLNTSGEFRICADTQMVQQDLEPGVHVYVHYFTLYDVRARGFVRPMCLSYISSDYLKLLQHFAQLREQFTTATEYLKLSNLEWFSQEMQGLIRNLEYTKDRYIQEQRDFHHVLPSESPPQGYQEHESKKEPVDLSDTVEDMMAEFKLSHRKEHRYKNFPNFASSQMGFVGAVTLTSHLNGVPDEHDNHNHKPNNISEVTKLRSPSQTLVDKDENDEAALLRHTSLEAVAMQLMECQHILEIIKPYMDKKEIKEDIMCLAEQVMSKPESPLYLTMSKLSMIEQPTVTAKPTICVLSLMKKNFSDMRSVQLLCGFGYVCCLVKLRHIHDKFSKPHLTLIFEDLDNEIHQNLYGSLFVGNIPVVNIVKSEGRASGVQLKLYSSLCWDSYFVQFLYSGLSQPSTPESEYADALDIPKDDPDVSAAADCLKVFPVVKTEENYFPPSSDDIVDNGKQNLKEEKDNLEVKNDFSDTETDEINEVNIATSNLADSQEEKKEFHSQDLPKHVQVDTSEVSIGRQRGSESQWSSSSGSSLSSSPFIDLNKVEDVEEEESVQEDVAVALGEHPLEMVNIDDRMVMSRICRLAGLLQQFCGVSHCLLHSLLSGRPVVVAAAENYRSLVMLYVRALSTLLPRSPSKHLPVLRWHTGTITAHHLQEFSVMGVCIPERLHVQDLMSNSTLNKVTVLNIETGHISGVTYSGTLVRGIEQYIRRLFHSNSALQSSLQAMLVTLGLKVYLYYHLLNTTNRSSSDILKAIGVSKGDWDIVIHLATKVHTAKLLCV